MIPKFDLWILCVQTRVCIHTRTHTRAKIKHKESREEEVTLSVLARSFLLVAAQGTSMWLSTKTCGPHLVGVLQCLSGQGLWMLYDPGQRSASRCAVISPSVEWVRCVWCQAHSLQPQQTPSTGSMVETQLLCSRKGDPVRATWKLEGLEPFSRDSGFLEVKTPTPRQ